MKINLLTSDVYNRISAGEVVENPASVVKELIENAIDAGAGAITVRIEDGGIKSIEVSDNGYGIEKSELPKAILPHATSKIEDADDLETISTLGFRGEALASISAVSEIEILTKAVSEEYGAKLYSKGGSVTVSDCAVQSGTTVTVKNLFFNTPARYKFLSSKSVEENKITRQIFMLILANPEIAFTYYADNSLVYSSTGEGLKSAISSVFLPRVYDKMIEITPYKSPENITVSGYIGSHEVFKNNRTQQIFVLNGRVIADQTLSATVSNAYGERMMARCFPVFVIEITMPFTDVDVNVHPNKREVRFAAPRKVYAAVYRAVQNTLLAYEEARRAELTGQGAGQNSDITLDEIDTANDSKDYTVKHEKGTMSYDEAKRILKNIHENGKHSLNSPSTSYKNSDSYSPTKAAGSVVDKADKKPKPTPVSDDVPSKKSFDNYVAKQETTAKPAISKGATSTGNSYAADKAKAVEAARTSIIPGKSFKVVGQLFDTYLVVEAPEKVIFIDQHAMHERIIFDSYMKEIENSEIASQPLLIPFVFESDVQDTEAVLEAKQLLTDAGFEIERFAPDAVKIYSIPAVLGNVDLNAMFKDLLKSLNSPSLKQKFDREALAMAACKAAIKGGESFSNTQIEYILNKYIAGGMPLQCPHGRPTALVYTKNDFEKLFRRKV